jgi:rhodanese-related sulfurtransferase
MSPSGAEVLRNIKSRIDEVDPADVREQAGNGTVIVDVREPEEWGAGHIPGAVHVPKSYLESRIEGAVPDREKHLVLYCGSGNRSAWAARTLIEDLGYEHVESMTGGFTLWKDRGYEVETPRTLTAEQRERYSRHLLLPEVGPDGQQKLLDAKVLLLGAGGLGSPAALYLAAAGVGTLGIVDNDEVDLSNLQRQVIHSSERIGVPKVDSAEQTITALNPDVKVEKYALRLGPENIMDVLPGWDMVVDGLDNFPTRYLLNDASVRLGIPVVSAAILGFEGQLSVFKPHDGPWHL